MGRSCDEKGRGQVTLIGGHDFGFCSQTGGCGEASVRAGHSHLHLQGPHGLGAGREGLQVAAQRWKGWGWNQVLS